MFLRRPKLSLSAASSSFDLLKDALAQYYVVLGDADEQRQLQSLQMDDLDFLEAIEFVERAVGAKIDGTALAPSSTLAQVAALFDSARDERQR